MFSAVEPSAIDSGIEAGAFLPKSDEIYSSHKPNTDSSRTNIQLDNYICVYDMSNSYVVPAGKARLRILEVCQCAIGYKRRRGRRDVAFGDSYVVSENWGTSRICTKYLLYITVVTISLCLDFLNMQQVFRH